MAAIVFFLAFFVLSNLIKNLPNLVSSDVKKESRLKKSALAIRSHIASKKAAKQERRETNYNPAFYTKPDWTDYDKPSYERMSRQWQLFDDDIQS